MFGYRILKNRILFMFGQ